VYLIQLVAQAVGSALRLIPMALAINVHGPHIFQQPKNFPQQMLDRSAVLRCLTRAANAHVHPFSATLLPPSPLDEQHLDEWKETADYAVNILALLAGIVDLETGFRSPLIGGSLDGQVAASLFYFSIW
jgi:hypothetical protein